MFDVQCKVHTHFSGEFKAVIIEIGDHDVAGSGMSGNRRSHDSDRASSRDQNVFTEHVERQRGVDSIAERIEDRCRVAIHAGVVPPDIRHWQNDEFRETARPVDTDSGRVGTEVPASSHTVAASPADNMPFSGNEFAGMKVIHIRADCDDLPDKLMTNDQRNGNRLLRPLIPVEDVNVSAADAGSQDPDQDIIDSDRGFGDVLQP